jgi:hypothetical protein
LPAKRYGIREFTSEADATPSRGPFVIQDGLSGGWSDGDASYARKRTPAS